MDFLIRVARRDELDTLIAIDDDAGALYEEAGVVFDLTGDHPFVQGEYARWGQAAAEGRALLAEMDGASAGMAVVGTLDGAPYLDQLAVRRAWMGRGVGSRLIEHVFAQTGSLWLNTYDHLPWNRPFYERRGFSVVPEHAWGPEMRAILEEQRMALPHPESRVVMRR